MPQVSAAPSCYHVSVVSGDLEVTARLKSTDDLELLVKVLEAYKVLFAKGEIPHEAASLLQITPIGG
jgi:hypothetical protein